MNYIPNNASDRAQMLKDIGVGSIDELFKDIPGSKIASLNLPRPMSELELLKYMRGLSSKNCSALDFSSFLGAGCYNHFIPAVVSHIVRRSEFYTAYTPYQPEVSQGTLQVIYEFQTMICNLTGMDVANASLYDGATALCEAANVAIHHTGRKEIVVSGIINPNYMDVLKTYANGGGWIIREDIDPNKNTACLIVSQPDFFGNLEETENLSNIVHDVGALFVVNFDPISLGILKRPADYGADIAVGEGRSLGSQMSFGGPALGLFAARQEFLRLVPGRLVGKTTDSAGSPGYVLTFQTREQHIRREKATSNICSNEALLALAACVYLSYLGPYGMRAVAKQCLDKTNYMKDRISKIKGYSLPFKKPSFKEFVVKTPIPPKEINAKLLEQKIIGGLDLGKNHMLICVTEVISKEEIDRFLSIL